MARVRSKSVWIQGRPAAWMVRPIDEAVEQLASGADDVISVAITPVAEDGWTEGVVVTVVYRIG